MQSRMKISQLQTDVIREICLIMAYSQLII